MNAVLVLYADARRRESDETQEWDTEQAGDTAKILLMPFEADSTYRPRERSKKKKLRSGQQEEEGRGKRESKRKSERNGKRKSKREEEEGRAKRESKREGKGRARGRAEKEARGRARGKGEEGREGARGRGKSKRTEAKRKGTSFLTKNTATAMRSTTKIAITITRIFVLVGIPFLGDDVPDTAVEVGFSCGVAVEETGVVLGGELVAMEAFPKWNES